MQTLAEVKLENLTKGDEIILSYWRGKHTVSHGVRFIAYDGEFIIFGVSKFFARFDNTKSKITHSKVRAIFTAETELGN